MKKLCVAALVIVFLFAAMPLDLSGGKKVGNGVLACVASGNASPPLSTAKIVYIHHSCGENLLSDHDGLFGKRLMENNYFVSDTNYGWGIDSIGDRTDIGNWWEWFRGPQSETYLNDLFGHSDKMSYYSRLGDEPEGENQIIMFKSCYPNSFLKGSVSDPVPPIEDNPLKGEGYWSFHHTVSNAKGIYIDMLEYFRTRPDKLFLVMTAPPLSGLEHSENARHFNNWLVHDWLADYRLSNVFVLDFYNILTTNGGDSSVNDLNSDSGNHHRWWNGAVQHKADHPSNTLAYSSGDDHPNTAGNLKASAELIGLVNVAYNRWKGTANGAPEIYSINPAEGKVGDMITISGTNFGDLRAGSHVSFEGKPAEQYTQWSDSKVVCAVPRGATSGQVTLTSEGKTSNSINFRVLLDSVSSRFYFAEGYTGEGFDEWLCVLNASESDAEVQIVYMFADGSAPIIKNYFLEGMSRTTFNVNNEAGPGKDVSIMIESSGSIVAERPMYFSYANKWSGGHTVIGATNPSREWYFAEGYTGGGFEQWLCILNPCDRAAKMTFDFQTSDGPVRSTGHVVDARSRATYRINDLLGPDVENALHISSDCAVVAERPMYFDYTGSIGSSRKGGHCVPGANNTSHEFYFAEGSTREGFDMWLTMQNPNIHDIDVEIEFQLAQGQGDSSRHRKTIKAESRATVFVADLIGYEKDTSVRISSESAFLAERPIYFNYKGSQDGGHCVVGSEAAHEEWLFAEGYTGEGFEEWLTLQNAEDEAAEVSITYLVEGGGLAKSMDYRIEPNQRLNVNVNEDCGEGCSVSCIVTSSVPIVAERPMYFSYGENRKGGHVVAGFANRNRKSD